VESVDTQSCSHNSHWSTEEQNFKSSGWPESRKFNILNKRKPYPLKYIGMVTVRDLMVYNNIFVTNEKHKRLYPLWWPCVRDFWLTSEASVIFGSIGERGVMWHTLAEIPRFAGYFPFTCALLREFCIKIVKTFHYILAYSGIVHEGYNSVRQTGPSRCVKWPLFLITRRMEFVKIRKCSDRFVVDVLGEWRNDSSKRGPTSAYPCCLPLYLHLTHV
jgi:hypothetical protein